MQDGLKWPEEEEEEQATQTCLKSSRRLWWDSGDGGTEGTARGPGFRELFAGRGGDKSFAEDLIAIQRRSGDMGQMMEDIVL